MKKAVPYIIIGVVLVLFGFIIASGRKKGVNRSFDDRVTLKQKDKIPYGTAAATTLLPSLFPNASFYFDDKQPGYWSEIHAYDNQQAIIFIAKEFNADEFELRQLLKFVKEGNHAFIIARNFSYEAQRQFGFSVLHTMFEDFESFDKDSMSVYLDKKVFSNDSLFSFPGRDYESWLTNLDTSRIAVLGRNGSGFPDFIKLKIGEGSLFIHTAPIVFSNYFILHKSNIAYFQQTFSVIPFNVKKVVWDEYYLTKKPPSNNDNKTPNVLSVLMRYPAFKWALIVAALTLALYIITNMRRKQRLIPDHQKPKNDSLDFVKTMGRLYHDRRDHRNLSLKMSMYFLEHVRTQYKLSTQSLDDDFEAALHFKSGYNKQDLSEIISFIRYLKAGTNINEAQLATFHAQLEKFYQNT